MNEVRRPPTQGRTREHVIRRPPTQGHAGAMPAPCRCHAGAMPVPCHRSMSWLPALNVMASSLGHCRSSRGRPNKTNKDGLSGQIWPRWVPKAMRV
eukprot:4187826-Lingulodinium_polyedra.AAC.1